MTLGDAKRAVLSLLNEYTALGEELPGEDLDRRFPYVLSLSLARMSAAGLLRGECPPFGTLQQDHEELPLREEAGTAMALYAAGLLLLADSTQDPTPYFARFAEQLARLSPAAPGETAIRQRLWRGAS